MKNNRYTVVYLPSETPQCPKCDGIDFKPVVKNNVEYGKCVNCGCMLEATHYEHMLKDCVDGCEIDPLESDKDNAKKK
jgi:hypothetical protein